MKKELGIFILLVVLCVIVAIINPRFIAPENLQNTARLIGMYGIFSIGLGLVIMTGGIDLSVGSVMALLGVLFSMMLTEWHWASALAVIAVIALTMGLGAINGLFVTGGINLLIGSIAALFGAVILTLYWTLQGTLVSDWHWLIALGLTAVIAAVLVFGHLNKILFTKVKLPPFIVTLCGFLFYRGLARFIANDETKGFGNAEGFEGLKNLATGSLFGVPMPFILLIIIAVVMWIVVHRSVYGRYLFAVGRNEEAARYSGINTNWIITAAYILCGALTGISGIILAFYTNSISPSSHGQSYELYGIAAAVLGGCSLRGGEGSIIGILIGTALLQVLQNLVNLLGIPSSLNFAVMGVVILLGVFADQLLKQRAAQSSNAAA